MTAHATQNTQHTPAYPGAEWGRISPAEAGLDPEKLEGAKHKISELFGYGY